MHNVLHPQHIDLVFIIDVQQCGTSICLQANVLLGTFIKRYCSGVFGLCLIKCYLERGKLKLKKLSAVSKTSVHVQVG